MVDQPPKSAHRSRRRAHRTHADPVESSESPDVVQAEAGIATQDPLTTEESATETASARSQPVSGKGRDLDRGWRDLAGNTPTLVGVSGALRARDVARPSAEDLAAAEREVVVVRRDWKPPDDAPPFRAGPTRPRKR